MGIRLSTNGGLTETQRRSCGGKKDREAALLKKLSALAINKPLLEKLAKKRQEKATAAATRRAELTKARTTTVTRKK